MGMMQIGTRKAQAEVGLAANEGFTAWGKAMRSIHKLVIAFRAWMLTLVFGKPEILNFVDQLRRAGGL